jgi:hypothetical protein
VRAACHPDTPTRTGSENLWNATFTVPLALGLARVGWVFTLTATAYNLIRLPKLVGVVA